MKGAESSRRHVLATASNIAPAFAVNALQNAITIIALASTRHQGLIGRNI